MEDCQRQCFEPNQICGAKTKAIRNFVEINMKYPPLSCPCTLFPRRETHENGDISFGLYTKFRIVFALNASFGRFNRCIWVVSLVADLFCFLHNFTSFTHFRQLIFIYTIQSPHRRTNHNFIVLCVLCVCVCEWVSVFCVVINGEIHAISLVCHRKMLEFQFIADGSDKL